MDTTDKTDTNARAVSQRLALEQGGFVDGN